MTTARNGTFMSHPPATGKCISFGGRAKGRATVVRKSIDVQPNSSMCVSRSSLAMMTLSTFRSSTSIGKHNIADMRIAKEFSTSGGFVVPLLVRHPLASYSGRMRYMNPCPFI